MLTSPRKTIMSQAPRPPTTTMSQARQTIYFYLPASSSPHPASALALPFVLMIAGALELLAATLAAVVGPGPLVAAVAVGLGVPSSHDHALRYAPAPCWL